MIPYEIQPPPPIIGKFRQRTDQMHQVQRDKMSHDFYKNQVVAKEMGAIEEKFYND